MKKIAVLFLVLYFNLNTAYAQPTTAVDFTMSDCKTGQMHNLYNILDSGNVVIMEFFMDNCYPCVDAGKALDSMYKKLKLSCPNIRFFQTSFNNTDSCKEVNKWVNINNFSSVPFDSGAAQISYYGFFGMPTVAVAAGNTHKLIYLLTSGGFADSDTTIIADSIRTFCSTSGITPIYGSYDISVTPKPSSDNFTVSFYTKEGGTLKIELENIMGQKVKTLADEKISSGEWKRKFPSENLPKGIYFLNMHLNSRAQTEKLIIQR